MMKTVCFLLLFINTLYANSINNSAKEIASATNSKSHSALAKAIKNIELKSDKNMEDIRLYLLGELMFTRMSKDILVDCVTINKHIMSMPYDEIIFDSGGMFETDITVKSLKKSCNLSKLTSSQLFGKGTEILYRTNDINPYKDTYNIEKALPYFELAEQNGYNGKELYISFLRIYSSDSESDMKKTIYYSEKLFTNHKKEKSNEAIFYRYIRAKALLAFAKKDNMTLDERTTMFDNLKKDLNQAKLLGSKEAPILLSILEKEYIKLKEAKKNEIASLKEAQRVKSNNSSKKHITKSHDVYSNTNLVQQTLTYSDGSTGWFYVTDKTTMSGCVSLTVLSTGSGINGGGTSCDNNHNQWSYYSCGSGTKRANGSYEDIVKRIVDECQ